MRWTPGPWQVASQDCHGARVTGAHGVTVGWFGVACSVGANGSHHVTADEAAANAELAAWAPEMLAILKMMAAATTPRQQQRARVRAAAVVRGFEEQ